MLFHSDDLNIFRFYFIRHILILFIFAVAYDKTRKIDLFTERKEVTLEDVVTPWASYEFRLYAMNELGISPPSDPSPQYNIPADRPYKYPSGVSGGGGKIGDLTITWRVRSIFQFGRIFYVGQLSLTKCLYLC